MKIFDFNKYSENEIIELCVCELCEKGSVLLLPTETVYGLMCRWDDYEAREKIYKIKKRSSRKPFQMLTDKVENIRKFGFELNDLSKKFTEEFCPGPITIILGNKDGRTLGFRIPDHAFIQNLIKKLKYPLAATSANLSGKAPALKIKNALENFQIFPELAVNYGSIDPNSMASTVVRVYNDNKYEILRKGVITEEILEKIKKDLE